VQLKYIKCFEIFLITLGLGTHLFVKVHEQENEWTFSVFPINWHILVSDRRKSSESLLNESFFPPDPRICFEDEAHDVNHSFKNALDIISSPNKDRRFLFQPQAVICVGHSPYSPCGLCIDPDYLVLKVCFEFTHNETTNDFIEARDFIEITFNRKILPTFDEFQAVLRKELAIEDQANTIIRKLPDSIIRNDNDVQRLTDYQMIAVEVTSNNEKIEHGEWTFKQKSKVSTRKNRASVESSTQSKDSRITQLSDDSSIIRLPWQSMISQSAEISSINRVSMESISDGSLVESSITRPWESEISQTSEKSTAVQPQESVISLKSEKSTTNQSQQSTISQPSKKSTATQQRESEVSQTSKKSSINQLQASVINQTLERHENL